MMLDYGKMFLGLVVTGIILIVVGLILARAQPRLDHIGMSRPPLSELVRKAAMAPPSNFDPERQR
jgi:type II secretory pathway component PulF